MTGVLDRRSWDDGSAQEAVANFNRVAALLEGLIDQRDQDVRRAMADYQADGVSAEYQAKEARWNLVAGEVRAVIQSLRSSLEKSGEIARGAQVAAASAASGVG